MSVCQQCGQLINSVIHCNGVEICYECCCRCIHHNTEISVLNCREYAFYNQLLLKNLNITKEGRFFMEKHFVIIPPHKEAYIKKINKPEEVFELIKNKVGDDGQEVSCRLHNDDFKMIISKVVNNKSFNKKAMSLTDVTVKGTAIIAISLYGNPIGMSQKAAKHIADEINRFAGESNNDRNYDYSATA